MTDTQTITTIDGIEIKIMRNGDRYQVIPPVDCSSFIANERKCDFLGEEKFPTSTLIIAGWNHRLRKTITLIVNIFEPANEVSFVPVISRHFAHPPTLSN